jgi:hypothetical protein
MASVRGNEWSVIFFFIITAFVPLFRFTAVYISGVKHVAS